MLVSMTGHGDASVSDEHLSVRVELRSVNNRHFKLVLRGWEDSYAWEPRIEALLHQSIQRGSVSVSIRLDWTSVEDAYRIRADVIEAYRSQLRKAFGSTEEHTVPLAELLALPGVVCEPVGSPVISEREWPLVAQALQQALEQLQQMRLAEGRAMERDLRANAEAIRQELAQIATRAQSVGDNYRGRLLERVGRYLQELNVTLQPTDVIREVALFAERSDISEESVRLGSHVDQFLASLSDRDVVGRKLDFLTQEMFREANTIGSKANDAEIGHRVVEVKNRIEKIREMVQNIE